MNDRPGYPEIALFVDGSWLTDTGADGIEVLNPSDEAVLGTIPCVTPDILDRALASAKRAHKSWPDFTVDMRRDVLEAAADLLARRAEAIADYITLEQGKPRAQALTEVDRVCDLFRYFATEAMTLMPQDLPNAPGAMTRALHPVPIGTVAAFTAWNFPLVLAGRKLAMAIAAGCPAILKAAEETPAAAVELVRALVDAGAPDGYVQLVFGVPDEISRHLIASPVVRKISLTGSIPVGKELARLAAEGVKPASLELGGHSAALIFEDADLSAAAKQLAAAKFANAGQVCTCPSRLLLQAPIHDQFIKLFLREVDALQQGDGFDPASTIGPLANARRLDTIQRVVADALHRGARLLRGGNVRPGKGFYFEPTVLCDVPLDSEIMQEEYFGPVAPFRRFETEEEGVEIANSLPYGLSAYVFTGSEARADRLEHRLDAGGVFVNTTLTVSEFTPFCGVKESGYGYEGGRKGLESFVHFKLVNRG